MKYSIKRVLSLSVAIALVVGCTIPGYATAKKVAKKVTKPKTIYGGVGAKGDIDIFKYPLTDCKYEIKDYNFGSKICKKGIRSLNFKTNIPDSVINKEEFEANINAFQYDDPQYSYEDGKIYSLSYWDHATRKRVQEKRLCNNKSSYFSNIGQIMKDFYKITRDDKCTFTIGAEESDYKSYFCVSSRYKIGDTVTDSIDYYSISLMKDDWVSDIGFMPNMCMDLKKNKSEYNHKGKFKANGSTYRGYDSSPILIDLDKDTFKNKIVADKFERVLAYMFGNSRGNKIFSILKTNQYKLNNTDTKVNKSAYAYYKIDNIVMSEYFQKNPIIDKHRMNAPLPLAHTALFTFVK